MTERTKIDDQDLEDISGAGGDVNLQEDNTPGLRPSTGLPQPEEPGGPGADSPEAEGGSGGSQDLQI